jgi:hypothetical protein
MKAHLLKLKEACKAFVRPRKESGLLYSLLTVFCIFSGLWTFLTYKMWFAHAPAPKAVVEHIVEEDTKASEEAPPEEGLSLSLIPKDILARQDGKEAEGHDLSEPSPKRALASLDTKAFEIRRGFHFYSLGGLSAALKVHKSQQHMAMVDFNFEVDSYAANEELKRRETEMRALMASVIATYDRETLLEAKGKATLKAQIMAEMNYRLKEGRVVDVLFSNFRVR